MADVGVSGGKVRTPVGDAPIVPVVLLSAGIYLMWFAIHYWKKRRQGGGILWPTDPIKAVLTGSQLQLTASTQTTQQATLAADVSALQPDSGGQQQTATGTDINHKGQYDIPALQQLWTSNGGHSSTAFIAANVAIAESSGNASATSHNPDGGINVGLWQLDTRGVGAGYTVDQLKDPGLNARITVLNTSNGTNWSEWADPVVKGGKYIGPTAPTAQIPGTGSAG
jgi:Lysozyme like domain